jgi:uncharacterized protein YjbI with pentapeptide repeats
MTIRSQLTGLALVVVLTISVTTTPRAFAGSINYQFSGTASGDFNGNTFSGAALTISIAGDTTGVTNYPPYFNSASGFSSISYQFASVTYSSTDSTSHNLVGNIEFSEFYLSGDSLTDLVFDDGVPATILNYDFTSNLADTVLPDADSSGAYSDTVNGGTLTISQFTNASFSGQVLSVPEPSAMILLAIGIAGSSVAYRRRIRISSLN